MAVKIVNQGLQIALDRLANIGGPPAAIGAMSVDDGTGSFAAANTKENDDGTVTQQAAVAFDATFPSRSGQVTSFQGTFGTGVGNFVIGRVSLHNTIPGSVSISSTTLYGGVSGLSITKTSAFSLTLTITITGTST